MFDDRLKNLRKSHGMSQAEIANILGLKPRTYVSYENNEREPDSQVLIKIAQLFDVSIDYLLNFSADTNISVPISQREKNIILAYRNQPEMQLAVERLLGVIDQPQMVIEKPPPQIVQTKLEPMQQEDPMLMAGRRYDGKPTQPRKLTKEQWDLLEQGEDVDLN